MPTKLDPIVSEFETQEQADSYDRWFRSTAESSINSDSPRIPHDEVMAGARHIIEQAKAKKKIGLTLMLTVKWADEAKTGYIRRWLLSLSEIHLPLRLCCNALKSRLSR